MARSWNKIEIMGNLTRDPELRFTPNGAAVCTFGVATNRSYMVEGERKEEVDFHRLVAWNKLAELCNQLLKKGNRVFISGRLQYREWDAQDGQKRREAEIVVEDMILITSRQGGPATIESEEVEAGESVSAAEKAAVKTKKMEETVDDPEPAAAPAPSAEENISDDDLPF